MQKTEVICPEKNARLQKQLQKLQEARELIKFYNGEPNNLPLKTQLGIRKKQLDHSNNSPQDNAIQEVFILPNKNISDYQNSLLKKAIQQNSLYPMLLFCQSRFIASPQMSRHLNLYEGCNKWVKTSEGKWISGNYMITVCSCCNQLKFHRLPCGSAMCNNCSEQMRKRRFHKVLSILADEDHAYLVVRLPELLKNHYKFNFKNFTKSRIIGVTRKEKIKRHCNANEIYNLLKEAFQEYFRLPIRENHYKGFEEVGFYIGTHSYSSSTLKWDIHQNIMISGMGLQRKDQYMNFSKKDLIQILRKEYLSSKDYIYQFAKAVRLSSIKKDYKAIRKQLILNYIKDNIKKFYDEAKIEFIDYSKLRQIINKKISRNYGSKYTDKNLYIHDAYSVSPEGISRKSPGQTAALLTSYMSNVPIYDKNIKQITQNKIRIRLKDTLKSNQQKKTISHQITLTHQEFFKRYQQHLLYVKYPERISAFRNLRGYGYYSNTSHFCKSYKRINKEPEKFSCSFCDTEIRTEDIGVLVFGGTVLHFVVSILHKGLRLFPEFKHLSEEQIADAIYKFEQPPDFLIPKENPLYLGEKPGARYIRKSKKSQKIYNPLHDYLIKLAPGMDWRQIEIDGMRYPKSAAAEGSRMKELTIKSDMFFFDIKEEIESQ